MPQNTIKVSQGVSLDKWFLKSDNSFEIFIYFSKSKLYTEVKIDITEDKPTAVSETIEKKLFDILSQYKTLNSYFFAPNWVKAFFTAAFIVLLLLDFNKVYKNPQLGIMVTIIGILVIYEIKPYSHFDTQQNNLRDKVLNWLLLLPLSAIAGLLIKAFFSK